MKLSRKTNNYSQLLRPLSDGVPLPSNVAPGLRRAFLNNGVLYRQFRQSSKSPSTAQLVVPSSMKNTVLTQLHNMAGHLGIHKTSEKIKERFYWPGYEEDIVNWVHSCQTCQKRNPPQPSPQAPLGTIKAHRPFEKVSWDIMGPLPTTSRGCKYILVITDMFSKWVEAFPLRVTDSETLAKVLVDEVVCRYGVPLTLHSDQGANLNSEVITSLCKQLEIERTRTTAYHPQSNGQVERFNLTLESMLSKVVSDNQKDWDIHLPKVLFAYRTSIHESTGFSPFLVTYGRSATLPIDVMLNRVPLSSEGGKGIPEYVEQVGLSLRAAYSKVRQSIEEAHRTNKSRHDRKESACNFAVGDLTWLYVPAVKPGQTKKFSCLWRGPYTVIDKTSAVNYRIQLLGSTKTLVVHQNRLKRCYGQPQWKSAAKASKNNELCGKQNSLPMGKSVAVSTKTAAVEASKRVDLDPPAGYTSTNDIGVGSRPQRIRRPPDRYRP